MRHGEPVGGHRYRGQLNDPLSERGWQQMMTAVDGHQAWRSIVTSPLRRCFEFAVTLGKKLKIPVHDEARFKEIGFGAWEGRTVEELRQSDPELLARFHLDPISHRPAGAEDSLVFINRVNKAWQELLAAEAGHHILVVAHAGVIRAIIGQVLEMPTTNMFRLQIDNASISRIRIEVNRPPTLVFHNGHL